MVKVLSVNVFVIKKKQHTKRIKMFNSISYIINPYWIEKIMICFWILIFFFMVVAYNIKKIKNISHTLDFRTILYTSSPCTDSALRNKMMTDCVKRGKAPGRLVTALLKVLCQIPTQITNPRCMTDNSVANFFLERKKQFFFEKVWKPDWL